MSKLKLSFLGSPQIEQDGKLVDIGGSKALALLAYLAVTGQNHSRDALGTLFWPDSDQSRARTYLRHTLWALKKELAEERLPSNRLQIRFEVDEDVWLDVAVFQGLVTVVANHKHPTGQLCANCQARLQEAISLYRDNFLTGFTLTDSPAFDEWQFFQTEELRQLLAYALERLVQEYTAQQAYDAALPYARRWLSLDPLHEPVHRTLMRLYGLAGQQAAALRQYQECVRLLEEELDVEPEEETAVLYKMIRSRQLVPPDNAKGDTTNLDRQATLTRAQDLQLNGQHAKAITLLLPLLTPDPADEEVHRELMQLYALNGRRHEALRQYQACCITLAALGTKPQLKTEELYQQITRGDLVPPASGPKPVWLPPVPIIEEMARTIPLVGRRDELLTLQDKIRISWHGQGKTILIGGEAGVGKTRLAYELLRSAAMFRMNSMMGAAYEQEEDMPYQPFIEAIDRYLAEQGRPQEQNPITSYKPRDRGEIQQEYTALFKATADFFTTLASCGSVVLLLDDLHAADEATLGLFHYIARHTPERPLILLATYRTDVTAVPTSPFGRLVNALYREQLSEVIELSRLSEADSTAIITHILEGDASPQLIKSILEITEGNPFFTQEITRAFLKGGQIVQTEGQWQLHPERVPSLPSQLRELLRERVKRLGPAVESVLMAAAVIGREIRFPILRLVILLSDHELLDALDIALESHVLEETDEGYRFHHSLMRRTLYDALSRTRRGWLHTRVAEAIEAFSNGRPEMIALHVEALAFHYNKSDCRERALPYLLQAGQKAMDVYALEVAQDYFEQALQLMDELKLDDSAQRWPALEGMGRCAHTLADTRRAVTCLEQALALSPTATWRPDPVARLQLRLLATFTLTTIGDMSAAERHLEAALAEWDGNAQEESSEYAYLWYNVSIWAWHRHDYQKAYTAAEQSLEVARRVDEPEAIARAYEMLAMTAHSLGHWQQGLNFESIRTTLLGQGMDVTNAFDAHL